MSINKGQPVYCKVAHENINSVIKCELDLLFYKGMICGF